MIPSRIALPFGSSCIARSAAFTFAFTAGSIFGFTMTGGIPYGADLATIFVPFVEAGDFAAR